MAELPKHAASASFIDYRPDVDGLRAIAVLAVVAYHAFPSVLRGGLIGVDIFFVISGFLITSIIARSLRDNRFSYVDFYVRRIKRIFPVLILVLAACLAVGWFALYDVEFTPLGRHVAGGAAFVSNFVLSAESGYFNSQSEYKQLLHLWSLGVEEQFYLVFPIVVALCWKLPRSLLPTILLILAGSFALNAWMIGKEPAATFYMPYTRFWELMIGAALAVAPIESSKLPREWLAWSGALLLLIALAVINESSAFPGWLALLPTAGAALLITAGPGTSVNRLLLSSRPLVFIGLISYSLYLWHWPVLAFQRVLSPENPGRLARLVAVALSFALAWLTYRLVERPLRHARSSAALAGGLLVIIAAIGVFGWLVESNKGFPLRAANERNGDRHRLYVESAALNLEIRQRRYVTRPCNLPTIPEDWCAAYGPENAETIVLWGDSYSNAWSPVFYRIADEQKLRVIRLSIGGCPPLVEMRRIDAVFANEPCARFGQAETVIAAIHAIKPSRVFIIARWSLYSPGKVASREPSAQDHAALIETQLRKTLEAMPQHVPVILFRTAPVLRDEPARALLRGTKVEYRTEDHHRRESVSNRAIDAATQWHPRIAAFDPVPVYCREICPTVLHDTVLYRNATHLSAQGVMLAYDSIAGSYFAPNGMASDSRVAITQTTQE